MNAPVIRSAGTSQRQKTLTMMLFHVATQVAASEQGVHLDTLAGGWASPLVPRSKDASAL